MNNYLPTIGLEIHAELKTKSKLFCGCRNDPFCKEPNIHTCPVCLGLPGALPVINQQAIVDTIKIGQALGGNIAAVTKWDRKHYFYPDLPKGYQISQYDMPLVQGGQLKLKTQNEKLKITTKNSKQGTEETTRVRITRIHLEEDTGKLLHDKQTGSSLVDLNRAGVPLVELVTEPDIHDAKVAADFAREYQLILRTLGVTDADMEKGMMRVEVNISLARMQNANLKNQPTRQASLAIAGGNDNSKIKNNETESQLGTKVEIKNLNSFKSVERAIEYEIKRQTEILEKGETIVQETRGWNDGRGTTVSQRAKETSADYRYFPEPDLPPIDTTKLKTAATTPLPSEIRTELLSAGINEKEIEILLRKPDLISLIQNSKFKIQNQLRRSDDVGAPSEASENSKQNIVAEVAKLLIHYPQAQEKSVDELIELAQLPAHDRKRVLTGQEVTQKISQDELNKIIQQVLNQNIKAVQDYQLGKTNAYGFLVGQVMKAVNGQSDPVLVAKLLKELLDSSQPSTNKP